MADDCTDTSNANPLASTSLQHPNGTSEAKSCGMCVLSSHRFLQIQIICYLND